MGINIFDSVFGKSVSEEDKKWAIYVAFSYGLSMADGEVTDDEKNFLVNYMKKNIKGLTESRWNKICKLSTKIDVMDVLLKLTEKEKYELIYYFTELANADGYFHGAELGYIMLFATTQGLEAEKIYNYVLDNYEVDLDEFVKHSEELKEKFKNIQL